MDLRAILLAIGLGIGAFGGAVALHYSMRTTPVLDTLPPPRPPERAPSPPAAEPKADRPAEMSPTTEKPAPTVAPERSGPVARWSLQRDKKAVGTPETMGAMLSKLVLSDDGTIVNIMRGGRVESYRVGDAELHYQIPYDVTQTVHFAPNASAVIVEAGSPKSHLAIHNIRTRQVEKYALVDPATKWSLSVGGMAFLPDSPRALVGVKEPRVGKFHVVDLATGQGTRDEAEFPSEVTASMKLIAPIDSRESLVFFSGLYEKKCPSGLARVGRSGQIDRIPGVPSDGMLRFKPNEMMLSSDERCLGFLRTHPNPTFEVWDWREKVKLIDGAKWSYTPRQCGFTPNGKLFWVVGFSIYSIRTTTAEGSKTEKIHTVVQVYDLATGKVKTTETPYKLAGYESDLIALSGNGKFVAFADASTLSIYRFEDVFPTLPAQF